MVMMDKKGQQQSDGVMIPIIIFIFAVAIFIIMKIFVVLEGIPIIANTPEVKAVLDIGVNFIQGFDWAMPTILIALNIYSLIMSFFLRSHPILFIVHLILIPVSIYMGAGIANSYEATLQTMDIANQFPITTFLFAHLPLFMVGFDLFGAILLLTVLKVTGGG